MGNSVSLSSSYADENDFVDQNVWFGIHINETSKCSGKSYSGFLRFPYEDPLASASGVAVFDPSPISDINKEHSNRSDSTFISGYCWRVAKGGKLLVSRKPDGAEDPLKGITWFYAGFIGGLAGITHAGHPSSGSTSSAELDLNTSKLKNQLWFNLKSDSAPSNATSIAHALTAFMEPRDDWGDIGKNVKYGKARFCWESPDNTYVLSIYPIDLSKKFPISETKLVNNSVFFSPERYKNWFYTERVKEFWQTPGKPAPDPYEQFMQVWLKTLTQTERSSLIFDQSKRCNFSEGNAFWNDPVCRVGCNGDGTANNFSLAGCPQIGTKISSAPYPNDFLRSKIGQEYCKQYPGRCETALSGWCASDAPDADGKYSKDPWGKKAMCACSWSLEIRRKKILAEMPSVASMLASDNIFTRQVGEKIIQSQLAYFTCRDPDCIQSAVYKNQSDKAIVCPSEQIQNCITSISISGSGTVNVGKEIANSVQCSQTLQQIFGPQQLECIKKGGQIITDAAGNSTCCTGQVLDGKCVVPTECPSGQVMKDGKCTPITPPPKCEGKILPSGECCTKDIFNGKCVEKCPDDKIRGASGACIKAEPCKPGEIRNMDGECIVIKPPAPTPDPGAGVAWSEYYPYIIGLVIVSVLAILIFRKESTANF